MNPKIIISGYRARKEVAIIAKLSDKGLYNLLRSEKFKDSLPKGGQLSPAHQVLIFEHLGIPYEFAFTDVNSTPKNDTKDDTNDEKDNKKINR